ncbi:unnamed protein product [Peronospora belbahrii]|uniref:Uncharacterized protein n=1 Tax=Peronospora belbahrii TaxID=622444 RepID=A0AAU9LD39_9STRA|nr:unnamed protein product [Peronospora belbahrii]CAH0521352.1 unnamed protein product [Peronospora belbahrii]
MIHRRSQWQQHLERENEVIDNVFEAQMRARMRRQSLEKKVEIKHVHEVETDCMTLDLDSVRSIGTCHAHGRLDDKDMHTRTLVQQQSREWRPDSTQEDSANSLSSDEGGKILPIPTTNKHKSRSRNDLVLKMLEPLTQEATFRLERLGGFDLSRTVPSFAYRVFRDDETNNYSTNATEGSTGVYRLPRLLHNSRVNHLRRPTY